MSRKQQNRTSFEDDGRVIAPMNVEGMPWYTPKNPMVGESSPQQEPLSRREERLYRHAAVKAGLMIAGVFGAAGFLLIEFLLLIWK